MACQNLPFESLLPYVHVTWSIVGISIMHDNHYTDFLIEIQKVVIYLKVKPYLAW